RFRQPGAEKALAAGAPPGVAVDHALLVPALLVGDDLAGQKLAEGAAVEFVFLGEELAFHPAFVPRLRRAPKVSRLRPTRCASPPAGDRGARPGRPNRWPCAGHVRRCGRRWSAPSPPTCGSPRGT